MREGKVLGSFGSSTPLPQQHLAALTWSVQANGVRTWAELPSDVRLDGAGWYPHARLVAAELDPQQPLRGSEVIAILSPRNRWGHNLVDARLAYQGEMPRFAFKYRGLQAMDIAAGYARLPDLVSERALKVRAFACNIGYGDACPHETPCVTLDTWMVKWAGLPDRALERTGVYKAVAQGVRNAAHQVGVRAYEMQAAMWLSERTA